MGLAAVAPAQQPGQQAPAPSPAPLPPKAPQAPQAPAAPPDAFESARGKTVERDDYRELRVLGGFRFTFPSLRLQVRGDSALVLFDRDELHAAVSTATTTGIPRRGFEPPAPRRRLSNDELRARLHRSARALGQAGGAGIDELPDEALDVPRYFYCEGGVVVIRDGIEVLRCERLWLSPVDDRIVVEDFELRYAAAAGRQDVLVVRGPRLVKHGPRWTGRDITLTTCSAGEPHAAAAVGEVEIIERDGEFEVRSRGQSLQIGGTSVLPLPDAHVFTGSQSQFPIKRVRTGYSGKEGAEAEVVFGLPWNRAGGALHHWLTGRPAHEFRGDWELGVGFVEERGVPLDGVLEYRAPGRYEGRTEAFWLRDHGEDIREILTHVDGTPIDEEDRTLLRTENRVHFGPRTHFDLVAWRASDPAVWSEFFSGPYRTEEVPETSTYLHHADGNRLLTVGSRFALSDFSYRDDRALADRFVEELPVVTYHWLAQPLGETPWGTPIVVDLATEIGQRRSDYDDRLGFRVSDRTLRADQHVEVSAPFHLASWNVRPFVAGRGTFYDQAIDRESEGRVALTAGVQLGTRLSRTWSWLDDGEPSGVRHVMAPRISVLDRFHVDDEASEFFTFDELDTLDEERLLRFELRNMLQSMARVSGVRQPRDFVFVDVAQDVYPDKGRDNDGDAIGLLRYDLLLRPRGEWVPFEVFDYALYGDHDWDDGLRTLDTELRFGPIGGIVWTAEYRTDAVVDGAVGLGASTSILGRWDLHAGSQRDIDSDEWLSYRFAMRRNDHDWSIELSASYDPFADETTFRLDFLPRFGSFSGARGRRFDGFRGSDPFADY